jgi:outer membrane protein assembly factor BamE (lipoprotein component of BamABCDE complex)
MQKPMFRLFFLAVLSLAIASLSACAVVYKLPTRQGNVLDPKQLDQLKLGMTRDQVHFLLGTPVASSTFQPDRWDYFGYYKPPRGSAVERTITLYFDGDKVSKIDGLDVASSSTTVLGNPDFKTMQQAAKKSAEEQPSEDEQNQNSGNRGGKPKGGN